MTSPADEEFVVRSSLQPKLRLFLSADIVGSTAFKQRTDGAASIWFGLVRAFYPLAEQAFAREWGLAKQRYPTSSEQTALFGSDAPELWKTVGDEVLFTKCISHPAQALMCMNVWLRVLAELRTYLQKPTHKGGLDVKSSAWIADFPVRNREFFLPRHGTDPVTSDFDELDYLNDTWAQEHEAGKNHRARDFIGQSIDTGFRLAGSATPRQMILSVELAHMLSLECQSLGKASYYSGPIPLREFTFRYGGRQSMKGVMGGAPYPLVWLDVEPEKDIYRAEDALMNRPQPSATQIHQFTSAFIAESAGAFCTQLGFRDSKPVGYEEHEKSIRDRILHLETQFKARDESVSALKESGDKPEEPATLDVPPLVLKHSVSGDGPA